MFVLVPAFSSLGYTPRSGIVGSCGMFIFIILSNCPPIFHSGSTILQSHQQVTRAPVSLHPCHHLLLLLLVFKIAPNGREVAPHCGFDLRFPLVLRCAEHHFLHVWTISISSLEKCLIKPFTHFLIRLFFVKRQAILILLRVLC